MTAMHIEILQLVDIKYSNDLGAGFYSEVFKSGRLRAVGIQNKQHFINILICN